MSIWYAEMYIIDKILMLLVCVNSFSFGYIVLNHIARYVWANKHDHFRANEMTSSREKLSSTMTYFHLFCIRLMVDIYSLTATNDSV